MIWWAALLAAAAAWWALPGVRRGGLSDAARHTTQHRWWWRWLRREPHPPRLPLAWELIAGCVAAGMPLRVALRCVADALGECDGEPLLEVARRIDVGIPEWQAWKLAESELGEVARDLSRSIQIGTGHVDVLRIHAQRARDNEFAAQVMKARRVGVKAVLPMTLCYLPAFVLVGVIPVVAGAVMAFFA